MITQMETHIYHQQNELKEYADKYGIQMEAWAPLAEGRDGAFHDETIKSIGEKYGKTAAQVMLRWNIQRGVVVLPKSTHKKRMQENFHVFDFELSEDDMTKIAALA